MWENYSDIHYGYNIFIPTVSMLHLLPIYTHEYHYLFGKGRDQKFDCVQVVRVELKAKVYFYSISFIKCQIYSMVCVCAVERDEPLSPV